MKRFFRRAALCLLALAAPFAASAKERPPEIAITFDDLPVHGPLPAGETRRGIADKMIAALKAEGLKQVYGFVNGGFADLDASGRAVSARSEAKIFFARMRPARPGTAEEIADGLIARMRSGSAA